MVTREFKRVALLHNVQHLQVCLFTQVLLVLRGVRAVPQRLHARGCLVLAELFFDFSSFNLLLLLFGLEREDLL